MQTVSITKDDIANPCKVRLPDSQHRGSFHYHSASKIQPSSFPSLPDRFTAKPGLFLADPPPELNRTPDEEGNEHQVWFDRNY